MPILIDKAECIGCGMCELICPEEAVKVPPSYLAEIDADRCNECLMCIDTCPTYALKEE